jgi:hypothetical protein
MLARRFTIVCLVTAIFGMVLAMLVAEARSDAGRAAQNRMPCILSGDFPCPATR